MLKHQFSLLLILITLLSGHAHNYDTYNPEKRPLINFFVGTQELSKCMIKCFEPIRKPILEFFEKEISMNSTTNICRSLTKTKACMATYKCSKDDVTQMRELTQGFEWACGGGGVDTLARVNHCIETIPYEERSMKDCKKECNSSLMNKLQSDSPTKNLAGRMRYFCEPFACYLNCTAVKINHFCPTAGSRLINQFLMPLDAMAIEMQKTSDFEHIKIMKNIPNVCRNLVDLDYLMTIRFDREFIFDVVYLLVAASQQNRGVAKSETERLLAEFDYTGAITPKKSPHVPLPENKWNMENIGMLGLMLIIMILNVVGLVFSIWWCLHINDENGEPKLNSVSTALLEPNIRMKLKLPKMKIHDSEVLKLRVPRNGNQFHQDEDEQTVVVPRQSRRRTYSVPLEPRSRTESTGSEAFPPRVVILRNEDHV